MREMLAAILDHDAKPRRTAMDWALKRGMDDVAARLAVDRPVGASGAQQDLSVWKSSQGHPDAHESGDPAALQSVEHFGHAFTWDELRDRLRPSRRDPEGTAPASGLDDVRRILAREGLTTGPRWSAAARSIGVLD